jgi:hypothetical protein
VTCSIFEETRRNINIIEDKGFGRKDIIEMTEDERERE